MMEAYEEYFEAARAALRDGATAHDVHRAVAKGFLDRGFHLGHVTGHSIGMTMIEFPKIGEGDETVLREDMIFSMHPHAISEDGRACLYMQDTWLVTADGGVPLADLPMRDLRRDRDAAVTRAEALGAGAARRGRLGLRALPAHRRAARAAEEARTSGPTATSCSSRPSTSPRSSG